MMPAMSMDLVIKWIGANPKNAHPAIKSLQQRVERAYHLVEKRLGAVDYMQRTQGKVQSS